ncbi:MAG: RNA chaperone Hfq [Acidobacteria bacterium]|nr:RNA chaperone Hfq [Acidobacteriota bacterium]
MNSPRHPYHYHWKKRTERPQRVQQPRRTFDAPDYREMVHPESTGTESTYLRKLIDSRKRVTVTMKTGERFHGRIRYYDRDCFSVGLSTEKRKIFFRKENVSTITEE